MTENWFATRSVEISLLAIRKVSNLEKVKLLYSFYINALPCTK